MTRFFTTASLIAVSFTAAQASADLVDHWTFDSADTSGNTAFDTAGLSANNAVAPDTAVYAAGFLGDGAASFTTAGSSIFNVASLELSNETEITISMWVQNEATQETDGSPQPNNNNNNGLFVSRDSSIQRTTNTFNGQFWGLNLERENNTGDFTVRGNSTGATRAEDIPVSVLTEWTHIAFTWTGDGVANSSDPTAVYINGVLEQAASVNADVYLGGSWTIGHDPSNGGRDYNGLIDDLAIFDEALTAQEVAALYNDGLNGLNAAGVPEPGSLALLGLGGLLIARRRRG